MNKRITNRTHIFENGMKRMLSIPEASDYIGLGKHKTREWCEQIGAIRKIGGRVLVDRTVVDRVIDAGEEQNF